MENVKLNNELTNSQRELLLEFYQHLIDNNPFPLNSFSKEREVDRFLKTKNKECSMADVSSSSFNNEKFIEALFAEYEKSYKETKQGQHYPQWLDDRQLKWVLTVISNCRLEIKNEHLGQAYDKGYNDGSQAAATDILGSM